MFNRGLWIFFATCLVAGTPDALCQSAFGAPIVLTIRLTVESTDGKDGKVIAEPTIVVEEGGPFAFQSGGSVRSKESEEELEFGLRVKGNLERMPDGRVRLAMQVANGDLVAQAEDPETEMVRTESIELRTVLTPGTAKRIRCSETRWCELLVERGP